MHKPDRREFLTALLAVPAVPAAAVPAPASPVAIAKCGSYAEDQEALLSGLFDKLGGLGGLVRNKTVSVKLNLTGAPGLRLAGRALGTTHYTHPRQAAALASLLSKAGARHIRFVESAWGTAGPLDEYLLDAGWNVRLLRAAAPGIELVNTNGLGARKGRYARLRVPSGGMIYPSYTLHPAYEETDVFVSLAKLKEHATCGVTLSMKNIFGITPASIYGDDAGVDEPNEAPTKGRVEVCHVGRRQPSKAAEAELRPGANHAPGYRMPRVTAELNAARPIHLSIIDGIETLAGGEGPWVRGVRAVQPGVVLAGLNPVSTDAVATAVMGFNPRSPQGMGNLKTCDNTLLLAESLGLGSAEAGRIDVRGVKLEDALYRFKA